MVNDVSHELSRRYAKAFMNVFSSQFSLSDVANIVQAADYLATRRRTRFFLRLPAIEVAIKKQVLDLVCKRFSLPSAVEGLIDLLLKHKRSYLLHVVLSNSAALYYSRYAIEIFRIISSHQLSAESVEVIKNFLAHKTGRTVICTHTVDKKLIAGLRLESGSSLWEYSVRKHVRRMQRLVI